MINKWEIGRKGEDIAYNFLCRKYGRKNVVRSSDFNVNNNHYEVKTTTNESFCILFTQLERKNDYFIFISLKKKKMKIIQVKYFVDLCSVSFRMYQANNIPMVKLLSKKKNLTQEEKQWLNFPTRYLISSKKVFSLPQGEEIVF